MQDHYSTVRPDEQREGIARVIDLMAFRERDASSGTQGGTHSEGGGTRDEKTG
jgi:hypothetical protein